MSYTSGLDLGQQIHHDWAGPWPLVVQRYPSISGGPGDLAVGLFLDYHGEIVDAGTFLLAIRADPNDWANGELMCVDPNGPVMIAAAEVGEQVVTGIRDLVAMVDGDLVGRWQTSLMAHHTGTLAQTHIGHVRIDTDWGLVAMEAWGLGWGQPDTQRFFGDCTPLPDCNGEPITARLLVWWNHHTNSNPWVLPLPDALQFAGAIESVLIQRRQYLDLLGHRAGLLIHCLDPQGNPVGDIVTTDGIDWDDLDGQAARRAEEMLRAGASRVTVSMGGHTLADFTVDDLVDEEQEAWQERYAA